MNNVCLIFVVAASLAVQPTTSAVTKKITLLHGSGLRTRIPSDAKQFLPGSLLDDKPESSSEKVEVNGTTWLKVTTLSKMWPEESELPVMLQFFFAYSWIIILASTPFILPLIDHQEVTLNQKIMGLMMLLTLFGGLYVFTEVIIFESTHFEQKRPLTMIECIYFMSQVITTVGYGDIVPTHRRGQVFVGLYVLGAISVIATFVSNLILRCIKIIRHYRQLEMWHVDKESLEKKTMYDLLAPAKPTGQALMQSMIPFVILDIIWVVFFINFPGEEKHLFEAFYMSLITMTSVGFGAITPVTEGGMVFAAFFMIGGSVAAVNMIGKFCEYVAMWDEYERFCPKNTVQAIDHLKQGLKDESKVSAMEFFRFVVRYQNKMHDAEVNSIVQVFQDLKPKDGSLSFESLAETITVHTASKGMEAGR